MFLLNQLKALKSVDIWQKTFHKIKNPQTLHICGVNPGFLSFLISSFYVAQPDRIFLLVCQDPEIAETFYANIQSFLPDSVFLFPEKDVHLPPDHPIQEKEIKRVKTLAGIDEKKTGVVVTSIQAISVLLPSVTDFLSHIIEIKVGIEIPRSKLIARLVAYGYEEVSVVENPGEFCRRGGIIDFFPFGENPVRIEFSGDTVQSLRTFDVQTQMSTGKINVCTLLSLNESFISIENNSTIFDYLNTNTLPFVYG
ncbi:MAG TPA: hypothetical protein PL060_05010, partial [bacterium]|nr:hypothetical protein [bacterium]